MPEKKVLKFEVEQLSILDEKGKADKKLLPKLSAKELLSMYEEMVLVRIFDRKAFALQRQGRLGTYAQHEGQEATQIGVSFAMQKQDWVFPSFREDAILISRGYPMERLYQYWGGDERGNIVPDGVNCFPISIPVGTQPLHAVGFSWAAKMRKEKSVSVVFFGDGATSEGDFHEAMNFAGDFLTPTVFVASNNQFAISVARKKQTRAKTIAQKAFAYGFRGVQVDGNDIFAVYRAAKEAIESARKGNGPTLIEAVTYRIADHTTADDASRYRPKSEISFWKKRDPIERLKKYLEAKKILDSKIEKEILSRSTFAVEEAVRKYEAIEPQKPDAIFNYMYYETPKTLQQQKEYLKKFLEETGAEK